MKSMFLAMLFQDEIGSSDSSMWVIVAVVLVVLVFIVVIIAVGLTIFFIARKRSKAQKAGQGFQPELSTGASAAIGTSGEPAAEQFNAGAATPAPEVESYTPTPEPFAPPAEEVAAAEPEFDPTRTVAIHREPTVAIKYGTIKFISGVLAGQEFDVNPEGSFIGRESNLSQIVVQDPRISKRHLWIGVRDGSVVIADQASRNGTFLNDPRSERVTEATLKSGDTVIMGESDVARFEFHAA